MPHLQYHIADCLLDCQTMVLSLGDQQVKLSAKVFDFLILFIENNEHIVNKEDAINTVWLGNEAVGKKGVTNAIWALRKAFTDLGIKEEVFTTIPKVGYQLILPVSAVTVEVNANNEKPAKETSSKLILFIGAVLIALVIFFGLTILNQNSPQPPTIEKPLENISVTTFEGIEEHPAISHDGNAIAFQWLREGQKGQIYIKNLREQSAPLNLISMSDQEETSPAWSLDDKKLAYARVDEQGQCEIRIRELVTNKDSLIDTGCYYQPFRNIITWSQDSDNEFIIYSKHIIGATALFKYEFDTQTSTQVTFPHVHESDFSPKLTKENNHLLFIREKASQDYNLMQQTNGTEKTLLSGQVSVVAITLNKNQDSVIVNYAKNGQFTIDQINLKSGDTQHISNRVLPSLISLNRATNQLVISDHISKEYVAVIEYNTSKITRRVSSSSRDMYGRFLAKNEHILFLSNRSGMWSVWQKSKLNSTNLTKSLGNVTVPAVSPDEQQYVVKIASPTSNTSNLYLGTLSSQQLQKLNIGSLHAENLSWSRDGKSIYFFSSNDTSSGIYNLNLTTSTITQITSSNEHYAIEADDGSLYVSRLNQAGIWQYTPRTKTFALVTSDLSSYDYGSFYYQNNKLFYLYRNKFTDEVIALDEEGNTEVVASFTKNTIRKYFGISKANDKQFIATLKITNEADLNAIHLSPHDH